MTDKTVKIWMRWSALHPDQRAYRQQSIDFFPSSGTQEDAPMPLIEVEIPLEKQYIANAEAILAEPLNGNPAPLPVLTIKGVRYVVDLFDKVFYDTEAPEDTTSKSEWTDEDERQFLTGKPKEEKKDDWNDDWSESTSSPTPVAVGPAVDDEWAEATSSTKDDKWDETEEKWE